MKIRFTYKKHEFEIDELGEETKIKYSSEIIIKLITDIIKTVDGVRERNDREE